jgi:SET domain-containing protein
MAGKRFSVRGSKRHGKGVFALKPIKAGELIAQYKGVIVSAEEAGMKHPTHETGHTMLVALGEKDGKEWVLDGTVGGNSMRFINHGCVPNAKLENVGMRVNVRAIRNIRVGQELLLDYQLSCSQRLSKAVKAAYKCLCGARTCRGTMLSK